MAIEIERKFLVRDASWRAAVARSVPMLQGYLAESGRASVRVRLEGDVARLNITSAVVGATRAEYEYVMPAVDARAILDGLCVGLVVAEIELRSEKESFEHPAWLGEEVTCERRYYNHQLALHPYNTWNNR